MAERSFSPFEGELFYICVPCAYDRIHDRTRDAKTEYIFVSSEKSSFTCIKCQQSFHRVLQAKIITSRQTPFQRCGECLETFQTACELFYHSYVHSGEWPYRCLACLQGFATNSFWKDIGNKAKWFAN
ncbi:hypothetical protein TNIN_411901 [Trichonephila inaurata madagascariensis]|uniref:C2H2-type domain-containing protein n=1 Tax=Trichonephila inaurata madagascariensis TaxID=2747483 RepID=A0A8X6XZD6_9ARAC|nr:hypothetical protein TNIN_411901 [Trichonephila inaurata madagascariensis]